MGDESPVAWEVQKVIGKRTNQVTGMLEYLIEWKNWDGEPTWEPEENCDCSNLIRKFERESVSQRGSNTPKDRRRSRRIQSSQKSDCVYEEITIDEDSSVDESEAICPRASSQNHCDYSHVDLKQRKLILREIIGAINEDELQLIVRWKGIPDLEKVPLQVLRRYFCQEVLDFLLDKIKWQN